MRRRRGREGGGGKRKRQEKEEGKEGGSFGGLPGSSLGLLWGREVGCGRQLCLCIYGPSENSPLAGAMREKAEPYCLLYPMPSPLHKAARGEGGPQTSPTGICPNLPGSQYKSAILRHGFLSLFCGQGHLHFCCHHFLARAEMVHTGIRRTLGACFSMLPFPLTRSLGSGCHLPKVT